MAHTVPPVYVTLPSDCAQDLNTHIPYPLYTLHNTLYTLTLEEQPLWVLQAATYVISVIG